MKKTAWNKGISPSAETRKKISENQKGRKHSEETKRRMSEAHKGHVKSAEHCQNLSKALKGRKFTEEWKAKISMAHKGRILPPEWRIKVMKNLKNGPRELHGNWKGGLATDDPNAYAKLKYLDPNSSNRKYNKVKSLLKKELVQVVYEENIIKHGHLTCHYCLENIVFGNDCIEHKTPISRGGLNERGNLVVSCRPCNLRKGKKTELEFRNQGGCHK